MFSSTIAAKAWFATAASSSPSSRSRPAHASSGSSSTSSRSRTRRRPHPPLVRAARRALTLPVAFHCIFILGFQTVNTRVLVHSIAGHVRLRRDRGEALVRPRRRPSARDASVRRAARLPDARRALADLEPLVLHECAVRLLRRSPAPARRVRARHRSGARVRLGLRGHIGAAGSPAEACEALGPLFSDLLADDTWLPVAFQEPVLDSGMGGGIGQWLLFRAADRSLSLFSLVVPPGSMTPVHDHLAWGLVGLYRGNQDEELYRPRAGGLDLVAAGRSSAAETCTPCSRRRTHRPRPYDLRGDLRLDPPARERHGLCRATHVRRADGRSRPSPRGT